MDNTITKKKVGVLRTGEGFGATAEWSRIQKEKEDPENQVIAEFDIHPEKRAIIAHLKKVQLKQISDSAFLIRTKKQIGEIQRLMRRAIITGAEISIQL